MTFIEQFDTLKKEDLINPDAIDLDRLIERAQLENKAEKERNDIEEARIVQTTIDREASLKQAMIDAWFTWDCTVEDLQKIYDEKKVNLWDKDSDYVAKKYGEEWKQSVIDNFNNYYK